MLQLGIRGLGIARFKFNPISWFLKGEQGAWYDPSDLTTLFQDSAGTTPVTAVEQPVGLMLDKSKGLALGAEVIGTFLLSSYWSIYIAGPTFPGSSIEFDAASDRCAAPTVFMPGNMYKCVFIFTITGSATITMDDDGLAGGPGSLKIYGNSIVSGVPFYFTATASNRFRLIQGGTGTVSVTSFSVKQIAGNHAFQATAGNRPLLSARVNLLTKTEDFSDGVWSKGGGCTVTGTNVLNLPVGNSYVTQTFSYTTVIGSSITISVILSGSGTTQLWFNITGTNGNSFNNSPTIPLTNVPTTHSFVIISPIANQSIQVYVGRPFVGNTDTLTVNKIDLRPTNSGALLPAYQRVTTASDYDTVGFPLYLKANGTSSAMSTNSIDFTATDKMTVVTGVRKLSDAAQGMIAELNVDTNGNGSFYCIASPGNLAGWGGLSKGTVARAPQVVTGYIAPISDVYTLLNDISAPFSKLRLNSNQVDSNTNSQGTGNFGNYPLYLFARAGTSLFLNGQFYGAIIRGAQSDTASVTQTENYMATKTGITF